jgi:hypothetical protein
LSELIEKGEITLATTIRVSFSIKFIFSWSMMIKSIRRKFKKQLGEQFYISIASEPFLLNKR